MMCASQILGMCAVPGAGLGRAGHERRGSAQDKQGLFLGPPRGRRFLVAFVKGGTRRHRGPGRSNGGRSLSQG